jgi:hypothetical protein
MIVLSRKCVVMVSKTESLKLEFPGIFSALPAIFALGTGYRGKIEANTKTNKKANTRANEMLLHHLDRSFRESAKIDICEDKFGLINDQAWISISPRNFVPEMKYPRPFQNLEP